MTVKNTGATRADWMYWMPSGNNMTLGPAPANNQFDMTQAGPFQIVHNFEVVATLNEKSNPEFCFEGQRVKATDKKGADAAVDWSAPESTVNADGSFKTGAKIKCPFGGAKWCDDEYHKKSIIKKHKDQSEINWVDGVGNDGLPKAKILAGGYESKNNFEAQVNGDRDCKCNWDVIMKVETNGTVSKNKIENLVCV